MRASIVVSLALMLAGCSGAATSPPAPASAGGAAPSAAGDIGSGGAGAGGTGAAAALAAIKDTCSLMPQDVVKQILPKATAPVAPPEPSKCDMGDGNGVVELSVDANSLTKLATLNPCEPVGGVGVSACYQAQQPADAFLQVLVGSGASDAILYVEVAGHDGKDHRTDAINVAKAIIAKLG
jgi:hypothetical protein